MVAGMVTGRWGDTGKGGTLYGDAVAVWEVDEGGEITSGEVANEGEAALCVGSLGVATRSEGAVLITEGR